MAFKVDESKLNPRDYARLETPVLYMPAKKTVTFMYTPAITRMSPRSTGSSRPPPSPAPYP